MPFLIDNVTGYIRPSTEASRKSIRDLYLKDPSQIKAKEEIKAKEKNENK